MKSGRIGFLVAYLQEINEKGVTDTSSPYYDRAITSALNALDVPFRRTVSIRGYTIRLKEDDHAS